VIDMGRCPVCESFETELFLKKPLDFEYFVSRKISSSLLICSNCGSIYQDPLPTKEECDSFYPSDYQDYSRKDLPLLRSLLKFMVKRGASSFVREHGFDKRILDFGCGDGSFAKALVECGAREVIGYEAHSRARSAENTQGLLVLYDLDKLEQQGPYDIIRLNHVIEHLSDLDRALQMLFELLSPTGKIVIQTPNPRALTLRLFKRYWGALHYPFHTVLISPLGLTQLSHRSGLRVVRTSSALMPTGWSMSVENLIKDVFKIKRRGRTILYGWLVIFSVPLMFLERFFSGGYALFTTLHSRN